MTPSLLCDEHIPYQVVQGLRRRGINVVSVQELGLRSAADEVILEAALQHNRVVYTNDADYLRLHAAGVSHPGIIYHHMLDYAVGEAIRIVALACEALSAEDIANQVEFV